MFIVKFLFVSFVSAIYWWAKTSIREYVFYVFFRFKKTWLFTFFEITCQKT